MTAARRLVTFADIDDRSSDPSRVNVTLLHEAELTDGSRVLLLDDRGLGSSGTWAERSAESIRDTSRMVVGPDAAPPGLSEEGMADSHWLALEKIAQKRGLAISSEELRRLPHDVVLSDRLLERIDRRE